jgi:hypothetical protein
MPFAEFVTVLEPTAAGYSDAGRSAIHGKENSMSLIPHSGDDTARDDGVIDECIEELDELMMSLDRFSPGAIAAAMATCLESLLGALVEEHLCTPEEVRALLRQIESGVLQEQARPKR